MENRKMNYKRFVIYDLNFGVYLGACMGLGFWSLLDAAGQDMACVFESKDDAQNHVDSWDSKPTAMSFIPVETKDPVYASISECVSAGIPAWGADGNPENISKMTEH